MEVGRAVRTVMARENARLGQRGYAIGEGDLQALLLLRRQSVDAVGASLSSRIEVLKARTDRWSMPI